ncbi:stage III sporulation protein AG [Petroclostridium sp. X23]|uniref:stage III sporulation protein AG n=1 Tax=Petroclostridium sp. X23 TaxID=3045146 RepID=UPI0024AD4FA6|nr:stage III sporulation protein AG [Petroclostridium sp. X23]WHH59641.1 stage III sporulation protein AG [Petroclostridium sp. X23]
MEWFKAIYERFFTGDKRMVNLAIVLIIGVIIAISGGSLFKGGKDNNEKTVPIVQNPSITKGEKDDDTYGEQLEKKLESILSQMQGVGKVSVMLTFHSGTEVVPATDTQSGGTVTEETDNQGGTRKVTQEQLNSKPLMLNSSGGKQEPLILKELEPKIKGVIIVAEGASDMKIKSDIYQAVKTVLGIPAHKVQVFTKFKN